MKQKHTSIKQELENLLNQRIMFIDGAMGTMIQLHKLSESDYRGIFFKDHSHDLKGNNDLLVLTQPHIIADIHKQYLEAGADIIETNTFNGTTTAQEDYNLINLVYKLNYEAAALAKQQVNLHLQKTQKKAYVAGAVGPTNKTASISPDVQNPAFRAITFDALVVAYQEQIEALLAGGADIILIETIFDTLNAKAAIYAFLNVQEKIKQNKFTPANGETDIPLMISVTITDLSGRTLTGQTVEAFWNSIAHANPLSVGINCALGAKEMRPYIQELARVADCFISCYPNAGLPNPLSPTGYDETPESLAFELGQMIKDESVNLIGGCCGTTPQHIKALVDHHCLSIGRPPEKWKLINKKPLKLSGLEPYSHLNNFTLIGERTNVAGSKKFLNLIKAQNFEGALKIAREQVENGANLLDINFDDGLLEAEKLLPIYLNYVAAEPDIAKAVMMVDSSKWTVLQAGLKCLQGKSVVNSISLKEGESVFLQQARELKKLGAAVIVMAFDENGQAVTCDEKVRICSRAYELLVHQVKFNPSDIIFDPNILTVATGLSEHDNYGVEFIQAVKKIKEVCKGSWVSGGVSNLSFAFRGQDEIREAMHSVFLYHAIQAGLDMAIVNAGMITVYDDINLELRQLVENVILNKHSLATEELLKYSQRKQEEKLNQNAIEKGAQISKLDSLKKEQNIWREFSVEKRIEHALVHGVEDYIVQDTIEVMNYMKTPLAVIEGPLMSGMKIVGDYFGAGKMFLPQVVKSARVMKKAVGYLEPLMNNEKKNEKSSRTQKKILLATVKGDVHDIGKNIVGVVLACNGYEVIDLGIMTPLPKILEAIENHQPDIIGFSGLITPSLDEMIFNLSEFKKAGIHLPVLIGGATTSKIHTAVKMDLVYDGPVIHVADASRTAEVLNQVFNSKNDYSKFKEEALKTRNNYLIYQSEQKILTLAEARKQKFKMNWSEEKIDQPKNLNVNHVAPNLNEVISYIDWSPFFWTWGLKGTYPQILSSEKYGEEAKKLKKDAEEILSQWVEQKTVQPQGVCGVFEALACDETVFVYNNTSEKTHLKIPVAKFEFPRQLKEKNSPHGVYYSLADFILDQDFAIQHQGINKDYLGLFAVTATDQIEKLAMLAEKNNDDYQALMIKALGDRIAEAMAEWAHLHMRKNFGINENLSSEDLIHEKYQGIRPAPGYPACPNHELKLPLWQLLKVQETIGIQLTETLAMKPGSSICGFYFMSRYAKYFAV